jgi:hypothetical protein
MDKKNREAVLQKLEEKRDLLKRYGYQSEILKVL